MRRIVPTIELLSYFKTRPDMLIFEGNCVNAADITLLSENDNYGRSIASIIWRDQFLRSGSACDGIYKFEI